MIGNCQSNTNPFQYNFFAFHVFIYCGKSYCCLNRTQTHRVCDVEIGSIEFCHALRMNHCSRNTRCRTFKNQFIQREIKLLFVLLFRLVLHCTQSITLSFSLDIVVAVVVGFSICTKFNWGLSENGTQYKCIG